MRNKFTLGWILAVVALLVLAGMGFMGRYYQDSGKLVWGIIEAVCLLVVPIILTVLLKKYKGCSKPFFFQSYAIREFALLMVMGVVCIVSMFLINHFFTVNSRSEDIGSIRKNIDKAKTSMITHYQNYAKQRRDNYMSNLKIVIDWSSGNEALADYVISILGNDTTSYDTAIIDKGDLFYSKIDASESVSQSLETSISKKTKWWQLPEFMNSVDSTSVKGLYASLLERSKNGEADYDLLDMMRKYGVIETDHELKEEKKKLEWSYNSGDVISANMGYFTDRGPITIWAVLVALAAFAIALLPYFATDRHPNHRGLFREMFRKKPSYK